MPNDVELGEGAAISGGVALPQGEHGAADTAVGPSDKHAFQTRFNGLFPNIKVVKCDNPKPHRWGKAPREYRGLNKVWLAEDLSRRDRKRIDPNKAVITAVPDLQIPGLSTKKEEKPLEVAAEEKKSGGFCTYDSGKLSVEPTGSTAWLWVLGGLSLIGLRRRRTSAG